MRRPMIAILAAAAVGLAGCGSAGSPAASRPNPPAPVVLSAFVARDAVRVSPTRVGAGPVLLTVANQSPRSIALLVSRAGHALARTAPINPGGVTQIKVDLTRGRYLVSALSAASRTEAQRAQSSASARTTTLAVGRLRPSGGGQLLQP